jgi:hypothetical protein
MDENKYINVAGTQTIQIISLTVTNMYMYYGWQKLHYNAHQWMNEWMKVWIFGYDNNKSSFHSQLIMSRFNYKASYHSVKIFWTVKSPVQLGNFSLPTCYPNTYTLQLSQLSYSNQFWLKQPRLSQNRDDVERELLWTTFLPQTKEAAE